MIPHGDDITSTGETVDQRLIRAQAELAQQGCRDLALSVVVAAIIDLLIIALVSAPIWWH